MANEKCRSINFLMEENEMKSFKRGLLNWLSERSVERSRKKNACCSRFTAIRGCMFNLVKNELAHSSICVVV